MFIIVSNASEMSISFQIILVFIIPPISNEIIVNAFKIFMLVLFWVINFKLLSP